MRNKEIKLPVFSKRLFDQLDITIEQAENGEGLEIAKEVYKKAVRVGDDTTANEANTLIGMLKDNGLLVAERKFIEQYDKTKRSAELLLKSMIRLVR